jgi:hypothetical protein
VEHVIIICHMWESYGICDTRMERVGTSLNTQIHSVGKIQSFSLIKQVVHIIGLCALLR